MEEKRPRTCVPVDSIYKRTLPFQKRGPLIAVEGLDGSGKSELVRALRARLEAAGQQVIASNWNDTTEIYNLMMRLNAAGRLDNDTRCLLGAVELAARYHYIVRPALDAGTTVLLSKYLLAAVAHSRVRGHSMAFVRPLYDFAHEPDVTLYVDIPVEVALARKRRAGRIGFWEAGLDLALDLPPAPPPGRPPPAGRAGPPRRVPAPAFPARRGPPPGPPPRPLAGKRGRKPRRRG